jgi:Rhodopirellula transposase DDE domain
MKLVEAETRLKWAASMTWKGLHPVVQLSQQVYDKGISLRKWVMQSVDQRLERHPELPKWDIIIRPASTL